MLKICIRNVRLVCILVSDKGRQMLKQSGRTGRSRQHYITLPVLASTANFSKLPLFRKKVKRLFLLVLSMSRACNWPMVVPTFVSGSKTKENSSRNSGVWSFRSSIFISNGVIVTNFLFLATSCRKVKRKENRVKCKKKTFYQ